MASDRQGELGWTPPRVPAAPRLVSGVSPGSSRGKLRSEYQASGQLPLDVVYGYHTHQVQSYQALVWVASALGAS